MVPASLRSRLDHHDPLLGAWTFLTEPLAAEAASRAGYDYVCIDGQHGLHDYRSISAQLAAVAVGGGAMPIVRVPWNEQGFIGQVLDAGAMGVIVPMVNSPDEAAAVVRACRYAPAGERSFGPVVAASRFGASYVAEANTSIAVIPMIETVVGLENVEAIAAVEGIDALYVGPADLSLSMGLAPGVDNDDPRFDAALRRIAAACTANGVIPGVHAEPGLVAKRREQGFRMMTIGFDLGAMMRAFSVDLATGRNA